MKDRALLKSCLASFAVVLLVLGFSTLLDTTSDADSFLPPYAPLFVGGNFISYCFIVIISVAYESALWLIYRTRNIWTLRMFFPSFMLLVVSLFAAAFLFFNSLGGSTLILQNYVVVLARVCVLVIAMSCSLAILIKEKK